MRKVLTDHSEQEWYIESDVQIYIKTCPACGKPLEVSAGPAPKVTHIVFTNAVGKRLGVFDLEALPKIPRVCFFCGYTSK